MSSPAAESPKGTVRVDSAYVKTLPGILKIVQLVSSLLGFICIKFTTAFISPIFYNILYWVSIIITGFVLVMYSCHFVERFDKLPWLKFEMIYCIIVVIGYSVLSILASLIGENVGYATVFFGIVAIIAYAYDGFLNYRKWRRGLPAQ